MRYNFEVNPCAFKLFVEDATNEKINSLINSYESFRISYSTEENDNKPISLIEILEGISDFQQIIMWGINKDGSKVSLAYWLVGDGDLISDRIEYTEALEDFKKMKGLEIISQ